MKKYLFLIPLILTSCKVEAPKVDTQTKLHQDMASLMAIYTVDSTILHDTLDKEDIDDITKTAIKNYENIVYKDLKEAEKLVNENNPSAQKKVDNTKLEVLNLTKHVIN